MNDSATDERREAASDFPIFSKINGIEVVTIPALTFRALMKDLPETLEEMSGEHSHTATFDARVTAALDSLRLAGGRTTDIEQDLEVARFLALRIGSNTMPAALKACHEQFGGQRTPSISALGRFWTRLRHFDRRLNSAMRTDRRK